MFNDRTLVLGLSPITKLNRGITIQLEYALNLWNFCYTRDGKGVAKLFRKFVKSPLGENFSLVWSNIALV